MLRCWYTGLSAALLATASLYAPFEHVHPADPDHHHAGGGFAHSHFATVHHDYEGPEWAAHDDDEAAVYLEWAPAAAQRIAVAYADAATGFAWRLALATVSPVPELEPQSHSPPCSRRRPARAPPISSRLDA